MSLHACNEFCNIGEGHKWQKIVCYDDTAESRESFKKDLQKAKEEIEKILDNL